MRRKLSPLLVHPRLVSASYANRRTSKLTWRRAFFVMLFFVGFFSLHAYTATSSDEGSVERRRHHPASMRIQDVVSERRNVSTIGNDGKPDASSVQHFVKPGLPPPPRQILVLGSHHTGTSLVTRLLMEMGAYASDNLEMLPGNPLKYNEHRDALNLDKWVMKLGEPRPSHGPSWLSWGFRFSSVDKASQDKFHRKIEEIVTSMDIGAMKHNRKAWVIKDPRMSILAKEWISKLRDPICVLVLRDPETTSRRMAESYNRGPSQSLSVKEWAQVWEESMVNAVRACVDRNALIVYAFHEELAANPKRLVDYFAEVITSSSSDRGEILKRLSEEELSRLLGPKFSEMARHLPKNEKEPVELSERCRSLWVALKNREATTYPLNLLVQGPSWTPQLLHWEGDSSLIPNSVPVTSDKKKEAYVTMITSNDVGFIAGALVLGASIRSFDQEREMLAMMSVEVKDPKSEAALMRGGWKIQHVDKVEEPWYGVHPKCRQFTSSQRVRWGRMFSKLRLYELTQYDRIIYLDTDTVVLRPLDPWFTSLPGEFYGERSPSHRGINAGIMVIRPSNKVFEDLLKYAKSNPPMVFWPNNQVGCTEQELLNRYWGASSFSRKLNDTRHFDYLGERFTTDEGREEIRMRGARVAHCLTTKCHKPWDVTARSLHPSTKRLFETTTENILQGHCDPIVYLHWHALFWEDGFIAAAVKELLSDTANQIPAGLAPNSVEGIPQDEKGRRFAEYHSAEVLFTPKAAGHNDNNHDDFASPRFKPRDFVTKVHRGAKISTGSWSSRGPGRGGMVEGAV